MFRWARIGLFIYLFFSFLIINNSFSVSSASACTLTVLDFSALSKTSNWFSILFSFPELSNSPSELSAVLLPLTLSITVLPRGLNLVDEFIASRFCRSARFQQLGTSPIIIDWRQFHYIWKDERHSFKMAPYRTSYGDGKSGSCLDEELISDFSRKFLVTGFYKLYVNFYRFRDCIGVYY